MITHHRRFAITAALALLLASVYANPLCKGGSGNSHYNGNAETYMDVAEAMGQAMVELLKNK